MKEKLELVLTQLLGYTWLAILTLGSMSLFVVVVKWFLSLVGVI